MSHPCELKNLRAFRIAIVVSLLALSSASAGFAQERRNGTRSSANPTATAARPAPGASAASSEEARPLVIVPPARPANGSLFSDDAIGNSLVVDFKPRRVGDLVFVDVIETSEANVTSTARRGRNSGAIGGVGAVVGALPVPGAAVAAGVVGALGARKYEGQGTTGRQSDVRARIAARVVEVLPNGDLRIEATKIVQVNRETEQLTISGIVRPRDVSAENAVPTTVVGDLRVSMNGRGVASADNAPGWLFRLFDRISPF